MFSKKTRDEDTAPQMPRLSSALSAVPSEGLRKGPRIASLINDGMKIEGDLSGDIELHIDGLVRGDLKVARLTVGETGRIEGSITAESLDCRGRITGSITAREIRLFATAHVDGDITHDELSIETGAYFQGRCAKIQRQASAPMLVGETLASPAA
jgi:cytoskeletal protein CcmA (bactofilin family)